MVPGPVMRPRPRMTVTPACSNALAASLSLRCSATSSRLAMAAANAASPPPGSSSAALAPRSRDRRTRARTAADRSIALLGMQARYGHSPPTNRASTSATEQPASPSAVASDSPAVPPPSTITSKDSILIHYPFGTGFQAVQAEGNIRPRPEPQDHSMIPSKLRTALLGVVSTGLLATALTAAGLGGVTPAGAEPMDFYHADFSSTVGFEWTRPTINATPTGETFLGPFANNTVVLRLTDLPPHGTITFDADVYVIGGWDGNSKASPDGWSAVANGEKTINTTFDNGCTGQQSFPANYPATNAPHAGATAVDTLGYGDGCTGDATYHVHISQPHSATSTRFALAGTGLEASDSWGLDNVVVRLNGPDLAERAIEPLAASATTGTGLQVLDAAANAVTNRAQA